MSVLETRVSPLASALQSDMLETAKTLRDALYDLHKVDGLTGGLRYRLEKALTELDFPHFIPIPNTKDALIAEYHLYEDMWWQSLEDADDLITCNSGEKADDLHKHLLTRDASLPQTPRTVEETQQFPELPDDLSVCDQCGKSVIHPDQAIEIAGYYCSKKCFDDSCEPEDDAEKPTCNFCGYEVDEDDNRSLNFDSGWYCDIHCSNLDDEGGE